MPSPMYLTEDMVPIVVILVSFEIHSNMFIFQFWSFLNQIEKPTLYIQASKNLLLLFFLIAYLCLKS
jgi:hypothetical protein